MAGFGRGIDQGARLSLGASRRALAVEHCAEDDSRWYQADGEQADRSEPVARVDRPSHSGDALRYDQAGIIGVAVEAQPIVSSRHKRPDLKRCQPHYAICPNGHKSGASCHAGSSVRSPSHIAGAGLFRTNVVHVTCPLFDIVDRSTRLCSAGAFKASRCAKLAGFGGTPSPWPARSWTGATQCDLVQVRRGEQRSRRPARGSSLSRHVALPSLPFAPRSARRHSAVHPPSTRREVPVTIALASEARKRAAPIRSSTWPMRPSLILASTPALNAASSK